MRVEQLKEGKKTEFTEDFKNMVGYFSLMYAMIL